MLSGEFNFRSYRSSISHTSHVVQMEFIDILKNSPSYKIFVNGYFYCKHF
jgi:hypothetical protein